MDRHERFAYIHCPLANFGVVEVTAVQQLANLMEGLDLSYDTVTSLNSKLAEAQAASAWGNPAAACDSLRPFINYSNAPRLVAATAVPTGFSGWDGPLPTP